MIDNCLCLLSNTEIEWRSDASGTVETSDFRLLIKGLMLDDCILFLVFRNCSGRNNQMTLHVATSKVICDL